ncbi:SpoIIE family protein phosphatase [Streptomyces avicenniae]|uniref:SpoIIE family protein phosphatase n=1 Tax=Streptomyces avicenniae TaxID=500153 RepID=UPI00069A4587|nr:SpoIIE family protein phosphatase [Streptomyces avicenniae]
MATSESAAPGPCETQDTRLRLLGEAVASEDLDTVELLRLTLEQAVITTAALGGTAHLTNSGDDTLHLASVVGLPRDLAHPWERLGPDDPVAPARAARGDQPLWISAAPGGDRPAVLPVEGAAGALCLPLRSDGVSSGVLTLFTLCPPDTGQHDALRRLAATVSDGLGRARGPVTGVVPWWQESGSRLSEAMAAVDVATWEVDLTEPNGRLEVDETGFDVLARAAGITPEEWDGRLDTWMRRVHPDDLPGVLEQLQDSITHPGKVYSVEYRVTNPRTGRISWVELRGHVTYGPGGEPLRMTGTGWDTTTSRMTEQVVERILRHLTDPVLIVDPADSWRVVYANAGVTQLGPSDAAELVGQVPWDAVPGLREAEEHFEEARGSDHPCVVDLRVQGRWQRLRVVRADQYVVVFLTDVTEEVETARAEAARAEHVEAVTAALAQALTTQDVVDAVAAQLLAPLDADGMLIHALSGGRLRLVGSVGHPDEAVRRVGRLDRDDALLAAQPRFFATQEEFAAAHPPSLAALAREGGEHAWAMLPLVAGGRPTGSLLLSFAQPHAWTSGDESMLLALSGLVAQALERARLYDEEHSRAQRWQRAWLPALEDDLPALDAAARYRSAGGEEAGGDWYEVIPLSGERVALVIGDVTGHGLREATIMARLRAASTALAVLDLDPEEMLLFLTEITARLVAELDDAGDPFDRRLVSCLYAVYDPTSGELTMASAGHLPPVVVLPDGQPEHPEISIGPPLGFDQRPYEASRLVLPPDSLVVLYTDGLLATAAFDPDIGMRRLTDKLAALVRPPGRPGPGDDARWLARLCDEVMTGLPGSGRRSQDDAAMLAVSLRRIPADRIAAWDLPLEATSARKARTLAGDQLGRWGLEELVMTAELIVSELIGNTVRHATGPLRLRLIHSTTLIIEVYDGSEATPRVRHAALMDESGRGLNLISTTTARWGTRYTANGKVVWAQLPLVAAL